MERAAGSCRHACVRSQVGPFSTWEKSLPKLVFDARSSPPPPSPPSSAPPALARRTTDSGRTRPKSFLPLRLKSRGRPGGVTPCGRCEVLGAQRPRGSQACAHGSHTASAVRCAVRYTALPKHYRFGAFQQFVKATANPTDKKSKKEAKSKVPISAEPSRSMQAHAARSRRIDNALAFPFRGRPLPFHARNHARTDAGARTHALASCSALGGPCVALCASLCGYKVSVVAAYKQLLLDAAVAPGDSFAEFARKHGEDARCAPSGPCRRLRPAPAEPVGGSGDGSGRQGGWARVRYQGCHRP